MNICGIPVIAILSVIVTAVGLYTCAKFVVAKHYELKRERAEKKRDGERIHAALDYAQNAHRHLTDPDLQKATALEIAGKIKAATKGIKISEQFEPVEPAQS